ncbi:MAG TPA: isoprenylcysteine carboxylmethyltransferase family protein [Acidimicrobiales bacterium]
MGSTAGASGAATARPRLSSAAATAGSVAAWSAIFAGVPTALSRRGPRLGWRGGRPSRANRAAVVPLVLGSAGLLWCARSHYPQGEMVEVSLVPERLIASGPYRYSRNPMYVSEGAIWLGWTLYYGSPNVLAAGLALATAMRYAVGREERTLEHEFGRSWTRYAEAVPRWA